MSRLRIVVLPLLAATAIAVFMRWPILSLPLERDEGAYAYIAARWLHGSLPYRDMFDHKPPLLYLLYMPALLLGPPGPFGIRMWASLLFLLQLPLMFWLGYRAWGRGADSMAILIYAVIGSAFSLQGLVFNSEQALALPALAALAILLQAIESEHWAWSLAYGVCLGLVGLIKPLAVPFLLPIMLLSRARTPGKRLWRLVIALGGLAIPWLALLGWWGAQGALRPLWAALVDYNRLYAAESVKLWNLGQVVDTLGPLGALLVCAIGGGALASWTTAQGRRRMAIVLWTAALLLGGLLGLRPYIHYYYPILAGLALLTAPVITRLILRARQARDTWRRLPVAGAALGLLLLLTLPFVFDNLHYGSLSPARQAEALYGIDGQLYFEPAAAVAAYIRAVTEAGDEIFVWASEPEIYLLSGRTTSMRYIYTYPLDLLPEARLELTNALRQHPPKLYVLYRDTAPAGFEALARAQGLRLRKTLGGYDIWAAPADAAR